MKSMREMVDDEQVGGIGCSFANFSYFTFAYALRFCTTQNDFNSDSTQLSMSLSHKYTKSARAHTKITRAFTSKKLDVDFKANLKL